MLRIFVALILTSPTVGRAGDLAARVVAVADGDTLTVERPDRALVRVRVAGVDAPELGQPGGEAARLAAVELAMGRAVVVRELGTDRYSRTVGAVILPGGRSLGPELVERGHAWWYRAYAPADADLAAAESRARADRRGLWAIPGPVPPWGWRRGVGVPATAGVVGNRRGRAYHLPHCRGVATMKVENRVGFGSAVEAEAAGFHPARDCPRRVD